MSMGAPGPQRQVSGEYPVFAPQARDQSPSPRGPMPSMTPTESPKPTPSNRRTSWLKNLGSHYKDGGGRPPARDKQDSHEGKSAPRRAFSHDVSSLLHLRRPNMDNQQQQQQQLRPPFGHQHSGSFQASTQGSFGPQYASPQHSFGPTDARPQYGSPVNSNGRQRSGSLPLPPGVTIDAREVSSVASNTPPQLAPQIELNLPPPTLLKDEPWLSVSPTHSGSPHPSGISSQRNSGSPHPSQNTSRHPSGVPSVAQSMTSEQRLENEETRDNFDVDKPLPSLEAVQDDHEHTGVKPPVPIGKYQPSWDPFNATPIAEEREGSEYSFGGGKISPPKLSPPNLDTVKEGEGTIDSTQSSNPVLAGAACVAHAAGATTTALAIADNVREVKEHKEEQTRPEIRETVVETREIDDDDIYDASPPPKSSRRSLSLSRPGQAGPTVPTGLAAGTATTASAITDTVKALRNAESEDNTPKDDDWKLVEHKDAPLAEVPKDEPSYFPPTAPATAATMTTKPKDTYQPTSPFNARLGIDGHSRNASGGHSRGISEVSAASAMSIGTMSPGEVVDASQVTVEQTSPSSVMLRDSLQSVVSKQSTGEDEDLEDLAPPKPAFMATGESEKGQRTPTMESVPGWFPVTPGVSEALSSVRGGSIKTSSIRDEDVTPRQEQPIISPLSPTEVAQRQIPFPAQLQQGSAPTFPMEEDRRRLSKAEMIPEAIQRVDDDVSDISDEEDESPYHETLGIIRGLGVEAQRMERKVGPKTGMVQSREPVDRQRVMESQRRLDEKLFAEREAESVRAKNAEVVGQSGQVRDGGKYAFLPDDEGGEQGSELAQPQGPVLRDLKAQAQQSKDELQRQEELLSRISEKGSIISREPLIRQRDEAERVRASNAEAIRHFDNGGDTMEDELRRRKAEGSRHQHGMTQSRDPEPLQRTFSKSERMRSRKLIEAEELWEVFGYLGMSHSTEPEDRRPVQGEAEKMRIVNAAIAQSTAQEQGVARAPPFAVPAKVLPSQNSEQHTGYGTAAHTEPQPSQREPEKASKRTSGGMIMSREPGSRPREPEAERTRGANAKVVQSLFEGNNPEEELAWRSQGGLGEHGITISREPEPRQADFNEEEALRLQNLNISRQTAIVMQAQGRIKRLDGREVQESSDTESDDGLFCRPVPLQHSPSRKPPLGMTISCEPEPRKREFHEEETLRLQNAQTARDTATAVDAQRMQQNNARALWTDQDQQEFDQLHGTRTVESSGGSTVQIRRKSFGFKRTRVSPTRV